MAMKLLLAALVLLATARLGAEEGAARLKEIAKALAKGDEEAMAPLKELHNEAAAQLVIETITSKRVGGGIKARMAEIVAAWPAAAAGRKTLHEWLAKHPNCDDETLQFFADIHLPETRGIFWNVIEQAKGEPAKWREPQRVALAVKALGFFEDNPDLVVARIGSFLGVDCLHVVRACAADALGGMRSAVAVAALVPHVEDEAIGLRVARSLYRLTGQHFDQQPGVQWRDWLAATGGKIDFKMLTASDFGNFLKMQALVQPDAAAVDMSTFYGIDVRGKGLLFILDVSASMNFEDRISRLRTQMQNILVLLASRPAKIRYGILIFGEDIESCFPRGIVENSDESRHKAGRFIEHLQASGGTPMVEALTYAATKMLPDGNIDTVFFLSDGQPSDGTPEMVLEATRKIYQRHQARFNTISIGEEAPLDPGAPSLMQDMASLTQGIFTQTK